MTFDPLHVTTLGPETFLVKSMEPISLRSDRQFSKGLRDIAMLIPLAAITCVPCNSDRLFKLSKSLL